MAGDWSAKEKAEMIDAYSLSFRVFEKKDAAGVLALYPPKYIAQLAKEQKLELDAFQKNAKGEASKSFQVTKSITYRINEKNNKKATKYLQTPEGEKYAIIGYTSYAIYTEGDKDSYTGEAIAIKIDGKWYFLELNPMTLNSTLKREIIV